MVNKDKKAGYGIHFYFILLFDCLIFPSLLTLSFSFDMLYLTFWTLPPWYSGNGGKELIPFSMLNTTVDTHNFCAYSKVHVCSRRDVVHFFLVACVVHWMCRHNICEMWFCWVLPFCFFIWMPLTMYICFEWCEEEHI